MRGLRTSVFDSLLVLAQALGRRPLESSLEICVVSNGLFAVGPGDAVVPEKAMILGPVKVIPQEYEHLTCRAIDVDPGDLGNGLIGHLLAELDDPEPAPEVAFRGPFRWRPTFQPVRLEAGEAPPPRLRDGGVYLLTGGLGGLGLAVAEYLSREVHARLVLTSRSGLPERAEWPRHVAEEGAASRAISAVEALEEAGSEVLVLAADVTDETRMRGVVAQARERFGRIDGVFHLAGVPGAGLIQLKTREAAARVLAAKVRGTRVLETVLADAPPDILVLFSSVTSVTGGIGQVDFSAASAFLDAFAQRNFSEGRVPTVAINWGRWQWDTLGTPIAVDAGVRHELDRSLLSFEEGIDALARVLSSGLPQVVVSTQDLRAVIEHHQSLTDLLAASAEQAEASGDAGHPRPALGTPWVGPGTETEERLVELWKGLLGIDRVGIHDNFFELGGHSLLGLQIVARVRDDFGVELSLRSLFDTPTVARLGARIEELSGAAGGEAPPVIGRVERRRKTTPPGDVGDLSEEAMDDLLVELLANKESEE